MVRTIALPTDKRLTHVRSASLGFGQPIPRPDTLAQPSLPPGSPVSQTTLYGNLRWPAVNRGGPPRYGTAATTLVPWVAWFDGVTETEVPWVANIWSDIGLLLQELHGAELAVDQPVARQGAREAWSLWWARFGRRSHGLVCGSAKGTVRCW